MKYETGQRLKEVAYLLYGGNQSELARKLEMKPQALTKYINGESMPGGLILIRLHQIGVNINWFLTGEGEALLEPQGMQVSEPIEKYLVKLKNDMSKEAEKKTLTELMKFSEAIKGLDISASLQRALLLVYARHVVSDTEE